MSELSALRAAYTTTRDLGAHRIFDQGPEKRAAVAAVRDALLALPADVLAPGLPGAEQERIRRDAGERPLVWAEAVLAHTSGLPLGPVTIATVAQFEAFQRGVAYALAGNAHTDAGRVATNHLGVLAEEFLAGFDFQEAFREEVAQRRTREAGL